MFDKQRYLIPVFLLIGFSIAAVSCASSDESTRDMSTPSTRLVGHWGYYDQGGSGVHLIELYFGQVDGEGFGSCVFWMKPPAYNIEEDWIIYGNYHIISENVTNVTFSCFEGDEVNDFFDGTFEVTEDGLFLKDVDHPLIDQYQYIDSNTEP